MVDALNVSLCCHGFLETHSVEEIGPELGDLPASVTQVQGLKAWYNEVVTLSLITRSKVMQKKKKNLPQTILKISKLGGGNGFTSHFLYSYLVEK